MIIKEILRSEQICLQPVFCHRMKAIAYTWNTTVK